MPFVEISPSLPIYYEMSGKGTPIVFIHPPHMGHTVFKYQHELSGRFQIITYDIRGHGRSGNSEEEVSISLLTGDLLKLMDKLGIDKAVIAGYSSGGSIAQDFVLSHPDRVKALVLSGGFPEVNTFLLRRHFQLGLNLVQAGQKELMSNLLAWSHKVTKTDQQELLHECLLANSKVSYSYYEKSLHYSCTRLLQLIQCPVLLLEGQFSHIRPYLKLYKRHIPQMKSILVANSLHQVPIKNYRSFNHGLRTFLGE